MTLEGWRTVGLLDVAEIASGQVDPRELPFAGWPLVAPNHIEEGTGRLLPAPTAQEQGAISGKYTFLPGDVLYSKIRPYLRKVALPQFSGLCSADMYPLRSKGEIEPGFMLALLLGRDFTEFATSVSMRTGIPKINREELAKFRCLLPPLPEQRKIAAILSSVDDAIEGTQAVIDQLQVVKKAMMAELLTRGLPGRHTRFKQTEIGEVPVGWEVARLDEMASVERGKFSHRPRNDPRFFGGEYPFIQTGDVAASGGRILSFAQTLNDDGLAISRLFPAGTIIITIAANIGDTGIATFPVAFPDSLVGIQAGDRIDNRFLELVLRTRKKSLEDAAPQNAQKNINLETLRPLVIQVPPAPEQREIADFFEAMCQRVGAEVETLAVLRAVKSALMSVLLTGEIRVTPDEATPS